MTERTWKEENPKENFEGFVQYRGEPSKLRGLIRGRQTVHRERSV